MVPMEGMQFKSAQSKTYPIENFVSVTTDSTFTDFTQRLLCLFNTIQPTKMESQVTRERLSFRQVLS